MKRTDKNIINKLMGTGEVEKQKLNNVSVIQSGEDSGVVKITDNDDTRIILVEHDDDGDYDDDEDDD